MEKQRVGKIINIAGFAILAAAVGVIILAIVQKKEPGNWFMVLICGAVFLFWLLMDIIKPKLTGEFEGKTKEQMTAYWIYCALGFVGYAGLAYFAIAAANSTGIYGAIAFAVTTMTKRRFLEDYQGISHDDGEDE